MSAGWWGFAGSSPSIPPYFASLLREVARRRRDGGSWQRLNALNSYSLTTEPSHSFRHPPTAGDTFLKRKLTNHACNADSSPSGAPGSVYPT